MIRRPPRSTLFPSRRSSDLLTSPCARTSWNNSSAIKGVTGAIAFENRSEEHTSELQSQSNLLSPLFFLNDTATTEIYSLPLTTLFRSLDVALRTHELE